MKRLFSSSGVIATLLILSASSTFSSNASAAGNCGNGILEEGEICDDGKTGDDSRCKDDCSGAKPGAECSVQSYCGDGILQTEYGEECDTALDPTCPASCRRVSFSSFKKQIGSSTKPEEKKFLYFNYWADGQTGNELTKSRLDAAGGNYRAPLDPTVEASSPLSLTTARTISIEEKGENQFSGIVTADDKYDLAKRPRVEVAFSISTPTASGKIWDDDFIGLAFGDVRVNAAKGPGTGDDAPGNKAKYWLLSWRSRHEVWGSQYAWVHSWKPEDWSGTFSSANKTCPSVGDGYSRYGTRCVNKDEFLLGGALGSTCTNEVGSSSLNVATSAPGLWLQQIVGVPEYNELWRRAACLGHSGKEAEAKRIIDIVTEGSHNLDISQGSPGANNPILSHDVYPIDSKCGGNELNKFKSTFHMRRMVRVILTKEELEVWVTNRTGEKEGSTDSISCSDNPASKTWKYHWEKAIHIKNAGLPPGVEWPSKGKIGYYFLGMDNVEVDFSTLTGPEIPQNSVKQFDLADPTKGVQYSVCGKCGDGKIDAKDAKEECDDSNSLGNDGCSSSCKLEDHYTCVGLPSVCFGGSIVYPTKGSTLPKALEGVVASGSLHGASKDVKITIVDAEGTVVCEPKVTVQNGVGWQAALKECSKLNEGKKYTLVASFGLSDKVRHTEKVTFELGKDAKSLLITGPRSPIFGDKAPYLATKDKALISGILTPAEGSAVEIGLKFVNSKTVTVSKPLVPEKGTTTAAKTEWKSTSQLGAGSAGLQEDKYVVTATYNKATDSRVLYYDTQKPDWPTLSHTGFKFVTKGTEDYVTISGRQKIEGPTEAPVFVGVADSEGKTLSLVPVKRVAGADAISGIWEVEVLVKDVAKGFFYYSIDAAGNTKASLDGDVTAKPIKLDTGNADNTNHSGKLPEIKVFVSQPDASGVLNDSHKNGSNYEIKGTVTGLKAGGDGFVVSICELEKDGTSCKSDAQVYTCKKDAGSKECSFIGENWALTAAALKPGSAYRLVVTLTQNGAQYAPVYVKTFHVDSGVNPPTIVTPSNGFYTTDSRGQIPVKVQANGKVKEGQSVAVSVNGKTANCTTDSTGTCTVYLEAPNGGGEAKI